MGSKELVEFTEEQLDDLLRSHHAGKRCPCSWCDLARYLKKQKRPFTDEEAMSLLSDLILTSDNMTMAVNELSRYKYETQERRFVKLVQRVLTRLTGRVWTPEEVRENLF